MRRSPLPLLQRAWRPFVFAAALPLLASCGGKTKEAEAPAQPTPVEAARVAAPNAAATVSGTGTLERRREMALSFRIAGVLTRMSVEAGDSVRAGQVIATIDPANLDARQQQTSADLERARRDVERDKALLEKALANMSAVKRMLSCGRSAALKTQGVSGRGPGVVSGAEAETESLPELIAIDLNEAIFNLGLIIGRSVSEDVLDRIFENFCIGK